MAMHLNIAWKKAVGILSKVDMEELKESKATFVFGQMNEPPGARARVALSGLTIAEYFRDGDGTGKGKRHSCSSLIISSVLHRLVLKYRHCWAVCLQRWVTSQHWLLKWD